MLKIQNLTKKFEGGDIPALNNINFSLNKGEFCILLGTNGSGKSTLLKTILDEYLHYTGKILINNEATQKNIIYLDQNIYNGTIGEMTLLENMALSFIINKKASFSYYENYRDKIISILAQLNIGLENFIDKKLLHLSGGQRQIIATLIAINSAPSLFLLDEHTSALDPKMQKVLMEFTNKKIRENNITSIMITHKLEDAINYGDRLLIMNEGKIIFNLASEEKSKLSIDELEVIFYKLHKFQ